MISIGMFKALRMIEGDPAARAIMPAGHQLLNRHTADAQADGLIVQDPTRKCAWALTEKGKAAINDCMA